MKLSRCSQTCTMPSLTKYNECSGGVFQPLQLLKTAVFSSGRFWVVRRNISECTNFVFSGTELFSSCFLKLWKKFWSLIFQHTSEIRALFHPKQLTGARICESETGKDRRLYHVCGLNRSDTSKCEIFFSVKQDRNLEMISFCIAKVCSGQILVKRWKWARY